MRLNSFSKLALIAGLSVYCGAGSAFADDNFQNLVNKKYFNNNQDQKYFVLAKNSREFNQALKYYEKSEYSKAIEIFENLLRSNKTNISARVNLGASLITRGTYYHNKKSDYVKAANDYRKAIYYLKYDEGIQNKQQVRDNLSIAEKNLKNSLKRQEIELTPSSRFKIAKKLRGQGNFQEAVVEYHAALASDELRISALEALGDIMRVLQNNNKSIEYYSNAAKNPAASGQLHLKLARVLYKTGKIDKAIKEYNKALADDSTKGEVISSLEGIWRSRISQNPKNALAHMNLGVILQKKGDFARAKKEYKIAGKLDPSNTKIRLNLATLYQEQGNHRMALQAYDSILKVTPKDPLVHYYKGTAYRKLGNKKAAIQQFRIVLGIDPKSNMAKTALYETVKELNPKDTIGVLHEFAAKNPNNAKDQYNYAFELHSRKMNDKALFYYQKALSINPKLIDAYLNISSIYKDASRYPESISILNQGLAANPGNEQIKKMLKDVDEDATVRRYEQAIKKHNLGDYKGAIQDYKVILNVSKSNPDVYMSLGAAYQAIKDYSNAIVSYQKASELDKDNSMPYYYMGTIHYAQKQYNKADYLYKKAIGLDPANDSIKQAVTLLNTTRADELMQKGLAAFNVKNYQEAIDLLTKAASYDSKNGYIFYYRGMTYDALQKFKLAIADYKKTVALVKNLNIAYYAIALDYDSLKNKVEAKKAYELFLKKSGDNEDEYVKYAKERLKEL